MTSSVAIIVRTKDRPLFLTRALENIATQTFTDYEVVVVNDGGNPDVVDAIVDAGRENLSSVQVLHRAESTGMEAATNAGIRASESTFIAVHDDDDLWEPTFLARSVETLESTGAVMGVVRTDQYFERITDTGFEHLYSVPFWGHLEWMNPQDFFRINRAVPISIVHRRGLHEELGYFDEGLPVVGDWEFNLRVSAAHEIVFIDENLAHWSQRPEATGAQGNSMIGGKKLHSFFDSQVRARAIRADFAAGACAGPYLYQAHLANEVQDAVQHTADETHQLLRELNERLIRVEEKLDRLSKEQQGTDELLRASSLMTKLRIGSRILRRGGQG